MTQTLPPDLIKRIGSDYRSQCIGLMSSWAMNTPMGSLIDGQWRAREFEQTERNKVRAANWQLRGRYWGWDGRKPVSRCWIEQGRPQYATIQIDGIINVQLHTHAPQGAPLNPTRVTPQ